MHKKDNVFRVGTLNQLDKRKRIDLLIRAFKQSSIDGELVIAGAGEDRPMLESLAGEDQRIKFLGVVPDDSLTEFYSSLSVFVSPTKLEGWGLTLCEALACRIPCVVLSDALIPEEIKSKCVVTDDLRRTLENWSGIPILRLLDNERWAKGFTWEKCVGEYEKLYREIANE
jgi:glycosyltransferase involved in cell wall biosynthesis